MVMETAASLNVAAILSGTGLLMLVLLQAASITKVSSIPIPATKNTNTLKIRCPMFLFYCDSAILIIFFAYVYKVTNYTLKYIFKLYKEKRTLNWLKYKLSLKIYIYNYFFVNFFFCLFFYKFLSKSVLIFNKFC